MHKKLNWISVGVSLATVHYGLGFLIGSGEAIYNQGSKGILYALSSALGLLSLITLAQFYLKEKYPIWDIMGKRYGNPVRHLVAFLSGSWMVGVVASQILGGSWALSLFGINNFISMIVISLLIFFLSMIEINRLSKLFFYMLILSSLTFFFILFQLGFEWIPLSVKDLSITISSITFDEVIGISLTTVLVTLMGMDFHQFLVRAKDKKNAIYGISLGTIILLVLSLLLLAIINGSIEEGLVGVISNPKQVVPAILFNFGNKTIPFLGFIFSLPLVFVSISSGGAVTRIVAKTISNFDIGKKTSEFKRHLLTTFLAFIIALTGSSIIDLVVSFYAIYVASIFIPFLFVLFDPSNKLKLSNSVIRNSIIGGLIGSLLVFINRFIPNSPLSNNQAVYIMFAGLSFSITGVFLTIVLNKRFIKNIIFYGNEHKGQG